MLVQLLLHDVVLLFNLHLHNALGTFLIYIFVRTYDRINSVSLKLLRLVVSAVGLYCRRQLALNFTGLSNTYYAIAYFKVERKKISSHVLM